MATPIPENTAPFSAEELIAATSARLVSGSARAVRGVGTDTRAALSGKAFVALRGESFDGHRFLGRAVDAGASALFVEAGTNLPAELAGRDVAVLEVPDTLVALGDLARLHRERWGRPVVAVGGSAGKTTTRSVLSHLFEALLPGRVLSTPGNLNNRVGVPLVLLGLGESHELAVIELGTNQPGEMAELARIARPDLGLLTLIDLEHTEGLGDLDGVEEEEAAFLRALDEESGVAIGWLDDPRVARSLGRSPARRKLGYSLTEDAFAHLVRRRALRLGVNLVELEVDGRVLSVETSLLGAPGTLAVLAGVTAAEALFPGRLDGEAITSALARAGEPGRGQLIELESGVIVLDDTYNSNPKSAEASLATGRELASSTGGRLFVVLGEMLELGALSRAAHLGLLPAVLSAAPSFVVGVQGDMRFLVEELRASGVDASFAPSADRVSDLLVSELISGDVVVVKASRGVRAERVVADLIERIGPRTPVSARSGAPHETPPRGRTPGGSA